VKIAVMHGPNLNRLGRRRPEKYGTTTLADIEQQIIGHAEMHGITVLQMQSNTEGVLIDWLHDCQDALDGIVINPAGLTPYGRSLYDALVDTELPIVVVHLSSFFPYEREAHPAQVNPDLYADLSSAYIAGFGARGYLLALERVIDIAAQRDVDTVETAPSN
jgi:3-dehydroquinate dehydratase II